MDPGVICGRSSPMLNDIVQNCQRISATMPPDGWDDSKSTVQQISATMPPDGWDDSKSTVQQISATMPPDGWDDSKSTVQQEAISKSKAVNTSRPSSPVSDRVKVPKQAWWKRLLRRHNGQS